MSKKVRLQVSLNRDGIRQLNKSIEEYKNKLIKGTQLGIEESTKAIYKEIINNCKKNDGNQWERHQENIICEPENGTIYTDDMVVVFNEFGTGAVGSQDFWANEFGYEVNQSGKGETGWTYYDEEQQRWGFTHGLPSRHMFLNALRDCEPLIDEKISLNVSKLTGDMYQGKK